MSERINSGSLTENERKKAGAALKGSLQHARTSIDSFARQHLGDGAFNRAIGLKTIINGDPSDVEYTQLSEEEKKKLAEIDRAEEIDIGKKLVGSMLRNELEAEEIQYMLVLLHPYRDECLEDILEDDDKLATIGRRYKSLVEFEEEENDPDLVKLETAYMKITEYLSHLLGCVDSSMQDMKIMFLSDTIISLQKRKIPNHKIDSILLDDEIDDKNKKVMIEQLSGMRDLRVILPDRDVTINGKIIETKEERDEVLRIADLIHQITDLLEQTPQARVF